jgi:hypothetical protein
MSDRWCTTLPHKRPALPPALQPARFGRSPAQRRRHVREQVPAAGGQKPIAIAAGVFKLGDDSWRVAQHKQGPGLGLSQGV